MSNPPFDQLFGDYPPAFMPLDEPEALGGGGGHSGARLWRYRAAAGQFVLRAWPTNGPGRAHIKRVHHWLSLTADLGFTPIPIQDNAGQSIRECGGRIWEIAPWMDGTLDCGQPPSPEHRRAAFAALAALHCRLAHLGHQGTSPGILERHSSLRQLLDGGFDLLEKACRTECSPANGPRDHALRWVELARLLAPFVESRLASLVSRVLFLQPCLRDARPEHFLFDGNRVSGLIDYGAMGIETVAADLARLIGEWLGGDLSARREALGVYEAIRPLDPTESTLIAVFESSAAILIGERWSRWHYLEHRTFDDPDAVASGIAKSISQMERWVAASRGSWQPLGPGGD